MSVITADEIAVNLLARYDKMERQLAQADNVVDRRLGNMEARGVAFAGRFSALLGGISVAALSREFLKFSDVSKQVEAQLRLATRTFGSFAQAQNDVQRISTETRNGLEDTAALYGGFARAAEASGKSQMDAARAVETFSKALKVGGAGTAQVASATLQLNQALSSTTPQWEELGQVFEASPRVQKLIADSLGVTSSALKKLISDGKLSRDQLFEAFTRTKFTKGIDDEFKTLPVTFGDAMQQVENAAITTFGAFDRGGQFSTALANFITDGSDGFKGLASEAEQTGVDIRATLAGLHDAFNPMLEGARSVFELLGGDARSIVEQVRGDISFILGAIDRFSNLGNGVEDAVRGRLGLGPSGPASDFQGRFDRGFNSRQQAGQQAAFRRALGAGGAFNLNKPGGRAVLSLEPTKVDRSTPSTGPKKKGPSAETLARRAEVERLRGLRNDESFENEKAELQRDLLRARQATATAADTVAKYEIQEIETARTRQNTSYQRDVSEKKLTQVRADELVALNDQLAAARSSAVQAERDDRVRTGRAALIQADLANARDLAASEGDLALTTRGRRDAALRVLGLEYQLERARLEAVTAAQTSTEAEKEIAQRRLAILPQLEQGERTRVERGAAGPLEQYRTALNSSVRDMDTALEGVAANGLSTLEDGLTGVISGTQSLGDAFSNMATRIIADLARIAIQNAILSAIGGAAGEPVGASAGKFLGGLFGGARAVGGPVSAGKTYLVGERGPELVRMGSAGTVVPNERLAMANPGTLAMPGNARVAASAASVIVVQPIQANFRGARTDEQTMRQFMEYADARSKQAYDAAIKTAGKQAPGIVSAFGKLQG